MHVTLQIICQNKEDKKVQLKFSGWNLSQSYFALANSLDLQIHSQSPHCFWFLQGLFETLVLHRKIQLVGCCNDKLQIWLRVCSSFGMRSTLEWDFFLYKRESGLLMQFGSAVLVACMAHRHNLLCATWISFQGSVAQRGFLYSR